MQLLKFSSLPNAFLLWLDDPESVCVIISEFGSHKSTSIESSISSELLAQNLDVSGLKCVIILSNLFWSSSKLVLLSHSAINLWYGGQIFPFSIKTIMQIKIWTI